jgi:HSP20 family protein
MKCAAIPIFVSPERGVSKMSRHRNPLGDLFRLQDRMNRVFDELTHRQTRAEDAPGAKVEGPDWVPAADVEEHEKEYVVAVDLPGVDRSKLGIEIEKDRLVVRGERLTGQNDASRRERQSGRFLRRFDVPSNVDQNAMVAEYKDGVLRVRMPKRPMSNARRVRIPVH